MIARTVEKFRASGVNVRINTRADGADPANKTLKLADGTNIPYDFLVIGTGSTSSVPKIPGIEREGVFTLKHFSDALHIKSYLTARHCRKAAIVGAGFIAMEMAEALRALDIETVIIHRSKLPASRWDREFGALMLQELNHNKVAFLPEREAVAIETGQSCLLRVVTNLDEIEADLVLFALGVKPDLALATALGLTIGESGAIKVNLSQATSKEGIYAVGDCCEVFHRIAKRFYNLPLGDIANKQGRTLGRNLGGGNAFFPGVVGAQSFKLFRLEVAATGIEEKEALASGYHPVSTIIWGDAIAGSMPGAKKIGLKMVADRTTGKLLGAQAVGETGAVSRINILSAALWGDLDLDDLSYLDLAYAPPFGGAWDVMHIAAQKLKKNL